MNTPAQSWVRPCTVIWLVLLAFTALTYLLGRLGLGGTTIMLVVLATAAIKVQMIAALFMGLRHTRLMWRLIMWGWLLLVTGLITVAYLISVN